MPTSTSRLFGPSFASYPFVMAYLSRRDLLFDGATFHISWECHNGDWFLQTDTAKRCYYALLCKYKDRYGVTIYSYSFMSNHPHLTGTATTVEGLARFMQTVNARFAKEINKAHRRRGQVIMDRYSSPLIHTDEDLLEVMIYGDLNQVRAKMVAHPRDWQWNSYHYYAHGQPDPLITPAPAYLALGPTDAARQWTYQAQVDTILAQDRLEKRPYTRVWYIGDPAWVQTHSDELRLIQAAKRLAYLRRQRRWMYHPPN